MIGQHGIRTSRSSGPPIRYDAVRECLRHLAAQAGHLTASVLLLRWDTKPDSASGGRSFVEHRHAEHLSMPLIGYRPPESFSHFITIDFLESKRSSPPSINATTTASISVPTSGNLSCDSHGASSEIIAASINAG